MTELGLVNKGVIYGSLEEDSNAVDSQETCRSWSIRSNEKSEKNGLIPRNKQKNSPLNAEHKIEIGKVNLQWIDVTFKPEKDKTILNGLCGSANSGELTAIMGPSGSGKTSLVNAISGFVRKNVTGQILVNGVPREKTCFRNLMSYIHQDDHILPRFTVRELITFASQLKISSYISEEDKQKAVDNCIHGLGLVNQQHQKASTLSGGQRKRLCIAQEIVNNPPLVILDEPTSGLDSSSCLQCVQLLKNLAEQGKNIICTIHQPSARIFEAFDNLYMISGGDCIYKGPTTELLPYLEYQGLNCPSYHSPTDFLTDVAIGLYGEWNEKLKVTIKEIDLKNRMWYKKDPSDIRKYKKQGNNALTNLFTTVTTKVKEISQESWHDIVDSHYPTSNFNQFRVLAKRNFLNVTRDPMQMRLKVLGSLGIGLLLGLLYYDTGNDGTKVFNTAGLLFTLMVFLVITAKIPTVLTFPMQRIVFEQEHSNGWYSTKMYYLAVTIAELPYQIICPTMNCGLLYWLTGQPMEASRLVLFLCSGVLISLIAQSIGLMIGAMNNVQSGVYLAVLVTGGSIFLCGSLLPLKKAPIHFHWLYHCNYANYAMETILINFYTNRPAFDCSNGACFIKDPLKFLKYLDMYGDLATSFGALLAFNVGFMILAYLLLRLSLRK